MGNTTDLSVRFKDYWDGFKPGEWQEVSIPVTL